MRCVGRTRSYSRCKRETAFLFCYQHRYQSIVILTGIITMSATFGGLYRDIIEPWAVEDKALVEKRLAKALAAGKTTEMLDILGAIKDRAEMKDVYNYYSGINLALVVGSSIQPEVFLSQIPPTSDYYIRAKKAELIHCLRAKSKSCSSKTKSLAEQLEDDQVMGTFYYYLRASDPDLDREDLLALLQDFYDEVGYMYNFDSDSIRIVTGPGESVIFEVLNLDEIPAVFFLLETRIFDLSSGSMARSDVRRVVELPYEWSAFEHRLMRGFYSLGDKSVLKRLRLMRLRYRARLRSDHCAAGPSSQSVPQDPKWRASLSSVR